MGGGFKIRVTFTRVDMEEGDSWQCFGCSCDHLEVFDGASPRSVSTIALAADESEAGPMLVDTEEGYALLQSARSNSLGRVCGRGSNPVVLESSGPFMVLKMWADPFLEGTGFTAFYEVTSSPIHAGPFLRLLLLANSCSVVVSSCRVFLIFVLCSDGSISRPVSTLHSLRLHRRLLRLPRPCRSAV